MLTIFEANDDFSFQEWTLRYPMHGSGGSVFSKLLRGSDRQPLYIRTPVCTTKAGFVVSSRKMTVDLLFSAQENDEMIRWVENLVNHLQKEIISHSSSGVRVSGSRDLWFQNEFTEADIDDVFLSPMKSLRGGRSFSFKCLVPANNAMGEEMTPAIKIYDESQTPVSASSVKENTRCIAILEVQGVKCTSKNFQLDVTVKQMMVLDTKNPFETDCLLSAAALTRTVAATSVGESEGNSGGGGGGGGGSGGRSANVPEAAAGTVDVVEEISFLEVDPMETEGGKEEVVTLKPPKMRGRGGFYDDDEEEEYGDEDTFFDEEEGEGDEGLEEDALVEKEIVKRNTELNTVIPVTASAEDAATTAAAATTVVDGSKDETPESSDTSLAAIEPNGAEKLESVRSIENDKPDFPETTAASRREMQCESDEKLVVGTTSPMENDGREGSAAQKSEISPSGDVLEKPCEVMGGPSNETNLLTEPIIMSTDEDLPVAVLKRPDQVYYEMFHAAREAAKKAKQEALRAYLDANKIKTMYNLYDVDGLDFYNRDKDREIDAILL